MAKAKAKAKAKANVTVEAKLLAAAKAGKVDKIFELAGYGEDEDEDGDGGGSHEADEVAFQWLLVAADFGHEAAGEAADDMLETSSFRYDDEQMVQGLIHLDLGEAYLTGADGLPIDPALAKTHLEIAREMAVHKTTDAAKDFPATRKRLSAPARAVFDAVFPDKKKSSKPPSRRP